MRLFREKKEIMRQQQKDPFDFHNFESGLQFWGAGGAFLTSSLQFFCLGSVIFFSPGVRMKINFAFHILCHRRPIYEQLPVCVPAAHCQHEGPSEQSLRWELLFGFLFRNQLWNNRCFSAKHQDLSVECLWWIWTRVCVLHLHHVHSPLGL